MEIKLTQVRQTPLARLRTNEDNPREIGDMKFNE